MRERPRQTGGLDGFPFALRRPVVEDWVAPEEEDDELGAMVTSFYAWSGARREWAQERGIEVGDLPVDSVVPAWRLRV